MDDLDYAWLRLYNSEHRVQKCLPEVSNKDFELLMDRLEKDSRLDPSVVANNLGSQGGAPGGEEPEDDAVCSICQDGEANNTNVILFCDMCNLPVHQVCFLLCCWLIAAVSLSTAIFCALLSEKLNCIGALSFF